MCIIQVIIVSIDKRVVELTLFQCFYHLVQYYQLDMAGQGLESFGQKIIQKRIGMPLYTCLHPGFGTDTWLGGVAISESCEVILLDCCPLVGWLGRGREVVHVVMISGRLGLGKDAVKNQSEVNRSSVGGKVRGHGLVAVAALSVVTTLW